MKKLSLLSLFGKAHGAARSLQPEPETENPLSWAADVRLVTMGQTLFMATPCRV